MAEEKLRVWWITQIPNDPFLVPVESLDEAQRVLNLLADYDDFQIDHGIKPDYSNAGGLEVFDVDFGQWFEWYNEDDDDIHDLMFARLVDCE